jgi:glycosyltransferase involved in cell wall biosynthesis
VKLIVQIPCYNEEKTLPLVLASIPRQIPGIDKVEVLVIDDGSTDRTAEVARQMGADYVVRHSRNRGLAMAFYTGLDTALRLGAHIIVNTDGDNQYPQEEIPRLIRPILEGRADVVIGDRRPHQIQHFSPAKRLLHRVGSWVVRLGSGTSVPDAPSGFRAFSREAALQLNVISRYTYTLETIIQAGKKKLAVESVEIDTNPQLRESRLIRGLWDYVKKSASTIVRTYAMYEPLKVFFYAAAPITLAGLFLIGRFFYFFFFQPPAMGHVQSVVIGTSLFVTGALVALIGLVADLIAGNRLLIEDALRRIKRLELELAERHDVEVTLGESEVRGKG